jgi:hypothetical protein
MEKFCTYFNFYKNMEGGLNIDKQGDIEDHNLIYVLA